MSNIHVNQILAADIETRFGEVSEVNRELRGLLRDQEPQELRSAVQQTIRALQEAAITLYEGSFTLRMSSDAGIEAEKCFTEDHVKVTHRLIRGIVDECEYIAHAIENPMFDSNGQEIKPEASYWQFQRLIRIFLARRNEGYYGRTPEAYDGSDIVLAVLREVSIQTGLLAQQAYETACLLLECCILWWDQFPMRSEERASSDCP